MDEKRTRFSEDPFLFFIYLLLQWTSRVANFSSTTNSRWRALYSKKIYNQELELLISKVFLLFRRWWTLLIERLTTKTRKRRHCLQSWTTNEGSFCFLPGSVNVWSNLTSLARLSTKTRASFHGWMPTVAAVALVPGLVKHNTLDTVSRSTEGVQNTSKSRRENIWQRL